MLAASRIPCCRKPPQIAAGPPPRALLPPHGPFLPRAPLLPWAPWALVALPRACLIDREGPPPECRAVARHNRGVGLRTVRPLDTAKATRAARRTLGENVGAC